MKTKHLLILGSLLFVSSSLFAQDKKDANKMAQTQEKEQARWMEYMAPGEMHKLLTQAEGDWHEEIVFWMAPKTDPTKAESECSNSMIMGGRYQESIHKGDMMGMPFEGKGLMGFDNIKKVFQSTWIDNMGTGIVFLEGPYDPKSKSITLTGKIVDPMTGTIDKVRQVMTFIDEKTQKLEMFSTKEGKEFKSMEINLSKR
jgi:hypothetical protein